jgi:hypothetical protein
VSAKPDRARFERCEGATASWTAFAKRRRLGIQRASAEAWPDALAADTPPTVTAVEHLRDGGDGRGGGAAGGLDAPQLPGRHDLQHGAQVGLGCAAVTRTCSDIEAGQVEALQQAGLARLGYPQQSQTMLERGGAAVAFGEVAQVDE